MYNRRTFKNTVLSPFVLALLGLLFMAPLIVTFTNSFMKEGEIALNYTSRLTEFDIFGGMTSKFQSIRLIPREAGLWQYADVLIRQPAFLILLANSIKLTAPILIGNLVVSMLTAFGFTVCTWKFKEAIFSVYIVVMLMPLQAVLVPNYIIADMLGIKESYLAIILPGIFSPFGVFLMRQSMKALPAAYFEAARMDGAGNWYIFRRIVAPQMKSAASALLMLMFIEYWNIVEQAVIFINDYTKEPLSVFLSRISEGRIGLVFAASCVYMFLPFWFLTVGQKDLERGIELSGVK
jgi:multiple sugar transport system permease protein